MKALNQMTSRCFDWLNGVLCTLLIVVASLLMPGSAHAGEDFLPPEKAFRFSAKMVDANTAAVRFEIAKGYYMYRERFAFSAEGAKLGEPALPQGKVKYDETFQKDVETYRDSLTIMLPVEANDRFKLKVMSQGCSDKGLCYPPMESFTTLSLSGNPGLLDAITGSQSGSQAASADLLSSSTSPTSELGYIDNTLQSGKLLAILPLFLLLGLGLSFTPCVLPMVPILSSIIVGEGPGLRRSRGFILSLMYSLGMAVVYTALGVAAGLAGEGLAASLQNPLILSAFAAVMVILSMSMFGVFQLQMPAVIQSQLMQVSASRANGKMLSVFVMGAVSALIVGPCVAAPLAGTLLYISQTRDVVIGGSALFAMAVGMSVPLLLVGVSAGAVLPRAGAWMESVKRFFGVLLLAVALWMISPVIPASVQMVGWAALGIGYGAYLLWRYKKHWGAIAVALIFISFGAIQLIGVATGGRDALEPLAHLNSQHEGKVNFKPVKTVAELDAILADTGGKMVVLDFYADWCVSCKEMEKLTFSDARVQQQLNEMLLLQIDVTANNADDKAMLKHFNLFGPPGIIFFDQHGREVPDSRVIGYQNAEKFLRSLRNASQT